MGRVVSSFTRHWQETGSGPEFRIVDPYGSEASVLRSPLYLARALALIVRSGLRRHIDLLHVHVSTRGSVLRKGLAVLTARPLRIPVVLHLHGADFDHFYRRLPRPVRRMTASLFRTADRVVVLGEYWRRFLVEELGLDETRIDVLLNAVRGPDALALGRRGGRTCRLLFMGRIEREKGIPELLAALGSPAVADLPWSIRLAGIGDAAPFERQADALGIGDRVEFVGWVSPETIYGWLEECDVFVLPSHREGLSMAVLEAMAYGLAVVTTPVGAHREAIDNGVDGVLVPVGDVEALAAALERVIGDEGFRGRLQAGARARFLRDFRIDAYCDRLKAIYASALALQRRR